MDSSCPVPVHFQLCTTAFWLVIKAARAGSDVAPYFIRPESKFLLMKGSPDSGKTTMRQMVSVCTKAQYAFGPGTYWTTNRLAAGGVNILGTKHTWSPVANDFLSGTTGAKFTARTAQLEKLKNGKFMYDNQALKIDADVDPRLKRPTVGNSTDKVIVEMTVHNLLMYSAITLVESRVIALTLARAAPRARQPPPQRMLQLAVGRNIPVAVPVAKNKPHSPPVVAIGSTHRRGAFGRFAPLRRADDLFCSWISSRSTRPTRSIDSIRVDS